MNSNFPIKKFWGYLFILSGLISASWQLLFLKVIQSLDFLTTGEMHVSAWQYAGKFPAIGAFLISVVVLIIGIVLLKDIRKGKMM